MNITHLYVIYARVKYPLASSMKANDFPSSKWINSLLLMPSSRPNSQPKKN